jgi:hypothetical protein
MGTLQTEVETHVVDVKSPLRSLTTGQFSKSEMACFRQLLPSRPETL